MENFGILDLSSLSLTSDLGSSPASNALDEFYDNPIQNADNIVEDEDLALDDQTVILNDEPAEEHEEHAIEANPIVTIEGDEADKEVENMADETTTEPALINFAVGDVLDQHREPKKGDVIQAFKSVEDGWYQVQLNSNMLRGYPHYYNCTFPDNTKGGIHLIPGESWSFTEIALEEEIEDNDGQDEQDQLNLQLEQPIQLDEHDELDGDNTDPETENLRNSQSLSCQTAVITPDTSTREMGLQTCFDSSSDDIENGDDQFIDDDFQDQEMITQEVDPFEFIDIFPPEDEIYAQPYDALEFPIVFSPDEEIYAQPFDALEFPVGNIDPLPQIPPDMIVDSNRRYNLIQTLNLDVPDDGSLVENHVYRLPEDLTPDDQVRHSSFLGETSSLPDKSKKLKAPEFLRKLNPFRKRK